jgi:hypothetical protein
VEEGRTVKMEKEQTDEQLISRQRNKKKEGGRFEFIPTVSRTCAQP